ncbi:2,3-diketo-5-methylthio-1-phosphopentane phosphatase [Bacillus salacetis]|uniref:2,3-diketo-5-methylthio-1-phosphopentane phosphatase n=1 Tax=Bacillus salacetis TaxID=2315464 RepID=A0A3A1R442_9BACI|nr:MtnX-like HAD-IB family phosphatase [Bacillus salacetis]RIW37304.1 2,3-diketo-5-methylthio-1-phosphopentane phosphatase [Bacillus salacetis]
MKKWAFVSDFDGTISNQDFYDLIIENHFEEGKNLYRKWKNGEMKDIDFLGEVFKNINDEEKNIIQEIHALPIDDYAMPFIKEVQKNGGDFFVLSAGTDYYINHLLDYYNIEDVNVFSNEGYYKNRGVHLNIDVTHHHYHERYGIDKSKVIIDLQKEYEKVHFIGDSEPDTHPAEHADLVFAKKALQDMLLKKGIDFVPVKTFKDVEQQLRTKGFIK